MSDINESLYFYKANIERVIDGDTIEGIVDLGFKTTQHQRFRLLGVDTPERGQENYKEAKDFVTKLVLNRTVFIKTEKDDAFGRYLAVVFYTDENGILKNLNKEIYESDLLKPGSKWNTKINLIDK